MAADRQRKTFLSYSRVNKDFAIKLAKELKSEGFDIWLDQLDIPAGSRWDREVEKALRESEIFMIILTKSSVDSENVLDEIGYAIDNSKRFLPVLLESCEVPLRLRRFQYVDFTNKSFDDGVESAKDLLRSLIAQSTIPQASFTSPQVQVDSEHKAKEEAERLAALKTEEERLAKEKGDLERRVKEEAERLYAQKAEEKRQAKAKADAERKAKTEARRKAKEEADRLAAQKAEDDHNTKEEAERLTAQKAEEERLTRLKAEEELAAKAKEEANRLAVQKAEQERLAQQADVLAAKAKADRLAEQKADEEQLTQAKAEAERKAKEKVVSAQATPAETKAMPVAVAPAQKKRTSNVVVYGIGAIVLIAVVGIGFSVLNRGNKNALVSTPTTQAVVIESITKAPATPTEIIPTNTATIAPTSTPVPMPIFLNTSDAIKIWESGTARGLTSFALTQHTSEELDNYINNAQPIPLTISDPNMKIISGYIGMLCATTNDILQENLQYIRFIYKIDDTIATEQNFIDDYYTTDDGQVCITRLVVIDNWVSGKYTVYQELTLTKAVFDGKENVEPFTDIRSFIITVP